MEYCRSCRAPIIWAITAKNKRVPLDSKPSPNGNIKLHDQGKFRPPLAEVHTVRVPEGEYYISHFATCTEAKKWRKK